MGRTLSAVLIAALLLVVGAGGAGAQAPRRGGTVVFGPVREPACLNPLLTACQAGPVLEWIAENVLPPAFVVAPDSTLRPHLARVSFTTRAPFTLTYLIRPEARWSDGSPVGARDFVFTHGAIHKLAPAAGDVHRQVRSVRAVDAQTVRVVLRSRVADWRRLFPFVLPRHALVGEDLANIWKDGIENPKTGRPIGSGPFLVGRWERGRQLTLVRNPRYWGPHLAYLDGIVLRFCRQACNAPPAAEVLEALRQGEVDFAFARDIAIVSDLRRIAGIRVLTRPSGGWEHLDIHVRTGHPALGSKLVRRALVYGIDRVEIVRRLFGELSPNYRPSDSAVFQTNSRYYRPNWDSYRYRPALARRLLEQAGCRRGADGIYVCADRRLSLRFSTSPGQPLRERTLQLVQAQLRQAGIEAVLAFGASGDDDVALFAWFTGGRAISGTYIYGCGGEQNFTGYCQRLVTRELDQADRILDADEQARVLNRVDRQLAKDVPVIPLYDVPLLYAHRAALRGVDPAPFNPFWKAENWWLAQGR